MNEQGKLKLNVLHTAYDTHSPFVLSVVADRRSVTKSKDDQKTVSFDFGASRLRSGQTVFKKFWNRFLQENSRDVECSHAP